MDLGGRVDGALGDVRDRSGQGRANLNRWALQGCSARDQPRRGGLSIAECAGDDDVSNMDRFDSVGKQSLRIG